MYQQRRQPSSPINDCTIQTSYHHHYSGMVRPTNQPINQPVRKIFLLSPEGLCVSLLFLLKPYTEGNNSPSKQSTTAYQGGCYRKVKRRVEYQLLLTKKKRPREKGRGLLRGCQVITSNFPWCRFGSSHLHKTQNEYENN